MNWSQRQQSFGILGDFISSIGLIVMSVMQCCIGDDDGKYGEDADGVDEGGGGGEQDDKSL